ncbi:hypothetical protein SRRS_10910 [Sporomusa rhizae]|uniref:hypothetical protein n=1 Tax=Sporomusa rhizae TaxID=357999 RepID=UPI00352A9AE4
MSSIVAVSAYDYSTVPTGLGDVSVARYAGGTSGAVIETKTGVVTQYTDGGTIVRLPGDTKVFHFRRDSTDYVLVAATKWVGQSPTCKYLIFTGTVPATIPSGYNWGTPVYGPTTWSLGGTSLANLYKIQAATISGTFYLYGIDYDAATAFRLAASGSTYNLDTTNYFTFSKPTTAQEGHGVDLQLDGSNVYMLYISGTNLMLVSSASYLNSTVVKTNLTFGSPVYKGPHGTTTSPASGELWPAENAFSIQPYGTNLLLVAVGGPQHYDINTWNPNSHIQKIALSDLTVTNLLRAATTAEGSSYPNDCYDFRALTFSSDGSQAYLLTGKYGSGYVMSWRLYSTDVATILGAGNVLVSSLVASEAITYITKADNLTGYLWALLYSENTKTTWFSQGNQLAIFNAGGQVGSAMTIGSLTTLSSNAYLNGITIYNPEAAPAGMPLKGYVAPAFASNTAAALIERKRLLDQVAAAKE